MAFFSQLSEASCSIVPGRFAIWGLTVAYAHQAPEPASRECRGILRPLADPVAPRSHMSNHGARTSARSEAGAFYFSRFQGDRATRGSPPRYRNSNMKFKGNEITTQYRWSDLLDE